MHDPKLIEVMARAVFLTPRSLDADETARRMATAALTALCAARPDVTAILRGEAVTVPKGAIETLHNALNCVIHEEDNDPPDAENAVRIARAGLDEYRALYSVKEAPPPPPTSMDQWWQKQEAARDEQS